MLEMVTCLASWAGAGFSFHCAEAGTSAVVERSLRRTDTSMCSFFTVVGKENFFTRIT